MLDSHPDQTPTLTKPLGLDKDGSPFKEQWSYASVVGMLLPTLFTNVLISHMIQKTHMLKPSIIFYTISMEPKIEALFFILPSYRQLMVDCFMDADFARQWNSEGPHDPLCIKSHTGYILMVGNCPIQWVSKPQMEIAVSMMEAKYEPLQCML